MSDEGHTERLEAALDGKYRIERRLGEAYNMGTVAADPETAYRFAKGLPVVHPRLGSRLRLDRPLDFLVVADHSPVGCGAPL